MAPLSIHSREVKRVKLESTGIFVQLVSLKRLSYLVNIYPFHFRHFDYFDPSERSGQIP